jgi:carbon-monoxide dehydrogenase small subunit
MAATAVNSEIVTVEGITSGSELTDVQQSFVEEGAVQCGFCTPGLIVAVHHLLDKNPAPSELEVKEAISGNICRCTGYGRVFAAVEATIRSRNDVK